MGYARAIPDDWIDALPKAQLLPRLRRWARRWMHAAKERKRQRVDRFVEDRGAGAAGGAAPAAGPGGDGSDDSSAPSADGSSGSPDSGGSAVLEGHPSDTE